MSESIRMDNNWRTIRRNDSNWIKRVSLRSADKTGERSRTILLGGDDRWKRTRGKLCRRDVHTLSSTNVVFPFIREMITRNANERSERETKRNEGAWGGRVGGGRKGKETKRKKERSERVTERCFNLHNDRSVPFRARARATRIRIYTRRPSRC